MSALSHLTTDELIAEGQRTRLVAQQIIADIRRTLEQHYRSINDGSTSRVTARKTIRETIRKFDRFTASHHPSRRADDKILPILRAQPDPD